MASRAASRAATRVLAVRLRPLGLEATQFPILLTLRAGDDTTVAALAKQLDLDPSTVTRNLQPLQRRGFVVARGGRGRAGKRLELSAEGEVVLNEAVTQWHAAQQAILAELGDQDAEALRASLARLEAAAKCAERKLEGR